MSRAGAPSVIELFDRASRLPASERSAFLDAACGGDAALREEVESLLAHLAAADGFLERTPFGRSLAERTPIADRPVVAEVLGAMAGALPAGAVVSRYRIERVLGEGGMGVVYAAEQENPRRRVALKVIRPGAASPAMVRRFEREAQVLGRLSHPGIAQIYEAGTAEVAGGLRQPYLAMELVEGPTLTAYARSRNLGVRERLELVARVCDAVEHAHRRGFVHRDLKPGNILVAEAPDGGLGQPKVLDFGVARLLHSDSAATLATGVGQLIGTLAYMSPEQAAGENRLVDARSDVYALGAILYELLAGRPPHAVEDRSVLDAARAIREEEPARLSGINRVFRGDIETIVLKALEKDPARRYPSAAALADDLRRHLAGEPISAKQDSALYLLQKRLRRYRWAVGTGAVFIAVVGALAVWAGLEARANRRLAAREAQALAEVREREKQVREQLRASNIERGRMLGLSGDLGGAERALWKAFAARPGSEDAFWALAEMYLRTGCEREIAADSEDVFSAEISPDGHLLATAGSDGVIRLWETEGWSPVRELRAHVDRLNCARFSPDGTMLASGGLDSAIWLWRVDDGTPLGALNGHRLSMSEAVFSRDGSRIYSVGQDRTVRRWDVAPRSEVCRAALGNAGWSVALHEPAGQVITGDHSGVVQVRDWETLALIQEFRAHRDVATRVAVSPDGTALATGGRDATVALWRTSDWSLITRADVNVRTARGLRFTRDGTHLLVTGTWTSAVVDAATLAPAWPALPEIRGGWNGDFTTDGRWVLTSGSAPAAVRVWARTGRPFTRRMRPIEGEARALAVSPDGSLVASGSMSGSLGVWDAATGEERARWPTVRAVTAVAFSPDGRAVASAHSYDALRINRIMDGSLLALRGHRGHVYAVAYLADGRVVSGGADGTVRVWDAESGRELAALRIDHGAVLEIATSPDDRWIVARTSDWTLVTWSVETLQVVSISSEGRELNLARPQFSPDSRRLLLSAYGGEVEEWEAPMMRRRRDLVGHTREVVQAVYSPDGSLIASLSEEGAVNLWECASGRRLATLRADGVRGVSLAWTRAGRGLVVSGVSGDLVFWDLDAMRARIAANAAVHLGWLQRAGVDTAALMAWADQVLSAAPGGAGTPMAVRPVDGGAALDERGPSMEIP